MEDKEAIELLKGMILKYHLDESEKEALLTAIGILGWSTLMKGRMESIKRARKRLADSDE